jgi:ppGpp synthetase/RelA/SpoT-type nucleotidyltranferase
MIQKNMDVQYQIIAGQAERLRIALLEQLVKLFEEGNITLGVPIESRVKLLSSVNEKIERKDKNIENLEELDDLVGIRAILLFSRDVPEVGKLIDSTFKVLSREDTAQRLGETQFGYQSEHYVIQLPEGWLSIPSLKDLGSLRAEIQVRTVAQHIWAAASHKLQYKQELSVPLPVRRAIHRVSALLETVDLEFERVLIDRDNYRASDLKLSAPEQVLNVDLVESILTEMLPIKNKMENEGYNELLLDLNALGIDTVEKLKDLISKHMEASIAADKKRVSDHLKEKNPSDRVLQGVFFQHVGWIRNSLRHEFGNEKIDAVINKRTSNKSLPKNKTIAKKKAYEKN